ncbi:alkaline phosphatase D family protein [Bacillus sp. Marseille-Q3570]|uniref:alkaline phosphatase D family protein n=1 Tax=Bacillus sp. Marseille-Q3570 TaxID=2963522 RepID=UPI0021B7B2A7|nr:alkaline phosphatase D family protein [Bacillus sp. Marseille-Q3570]
MDFEKWSNDLKSKKMNRKHFLETTGKFAVATMASLSLPSILVKPEDVDAAPTFTKDPFNLGVASGDPLPDSVVLWTRIAPNPLAADGKGGMGKSYVSVRWEIAEDERFDRIVQSGSEVTGPELGHSIHAEVFGLKPDTAYYYRFKVGKEISPVGKTKTAPKNDANVDRLSFAIASCQAWAGGRYAAYNNMVDEDLDFVLHLGDYIYEKGDTETLADYRLLHAKYKTSSDLQAAHAKFPFIVTFDDHEIDNDWSDDISDPNYPDGEQERFLAVRAAGFQAYYEHMPLRRRSKPNGPDMLLYRKFTFGNLAEFSVLDTRQYRDNQVGSGFPGGPLDPEASDPNRTIMGSEQEKWLLNNLERSKSKWNVIAQQTMMAQYDYDTGDGISVNHDQWDGYSADRDFLFDFIKEKNPSNPIVVSGDWHSSWVNDLKEDFNNPKSATLGTEFVGTSISSGCGWKGNIEDALSVNPHVKFFDGDYRGYVRFKVTHESWQSDYRVVSSANDPDAVAVTLGSFVVNNGKAGAQRVGGIDITGIEAGTMNAGQSNPVSVSLSNGTTNKVKVNVNIPVPYGWKSESIETVLEPASSATVEVMVTPPDSIPATEKLKVEVKTDPSNITVFGPPRDVQVVSATSGDKALVALDGGGSSSPIFSSYERLTPEDAWEAAKGYGWVGTAPFSRDRGTPDPLQRDLIASREELTTFRLFIPAGLHNVYFLTGDSVYGSPNTIIHTNDQLLADTGGELSPGAFKWLSFELDGGTEGKEFDLELTSELGDGAWRLVALVVMP